MNDRSNDRSPTACDLAVIGGGAAGLAAAIAAGEHQSRVVVLDGAKRLGAKILVSGGGRCNVTHDHVTPADFFGPTHVLRQVLAAFDQPRTVAWFESLGVRLKREDTGKLFPVTDSARTVLDALLTRCGQLGVRLLTDHRVHDLRRQTGGFLITHAHGALTARRVILATGGRSLPKTGSDGAGYRLVAQLGHSVTDTCPALAPLLLDKNFFHAQLSGLSVTATLATFDEGKLVDRRAGSLLFTHFGVSGPVAMDASRFWTLARARGRAPVLRCAFLPGSFEDVDRLLISQPGSAVGSLLRARLPDRLAQALTRDLGVDPTTRADQLPRELRRQLTHALTGLELPVLADRGWNYAEVTAGGVPLSEVDHHTMRSRLCPGLYLVGEILDVDGRIGGFNFQWAWSTGHIAGRAASLDLLPSGT